MCILTPVEKEHTELLGATLPRIAGEKAGIIKRSTPVFSGYQHPDVRRVFEQTAATMDAPLRFLSDEIQPIESRILPNGSEVGFRWANGLTETFELSMPGEVQAENAALAVLAIRTLLARNQTENLTVKAVERGLRRARLPGRMELFTLSSPERKLVPSNTASKLSTTVDKPARIIIDAAHTPVSVSRLLDSFRRMFPGEAVLIFGSVLGKNPQAMAEVLAGYFKHIFISTPGNFKKSDPEGVWRHFAERNPLARLVRDPREALRRALSASEMSVPILVTGSFYMVAEIRKILLDWNAAGPASLNFEHLR
jgi:dihydrofolate synthase/folylpolyglutamate synthase